MFGISNPEASKHGWVLTQVSWDDKLSLNYTCGWTGGKLGWPACRTNSTSLCRSQAVNVGSLMIFTPWKILRHVPSSSECKAPEVESRVWSQSSSEICWCTFSFPQLHLDLIKTTKDSMPSWRSRYHSPNPNSLQPSLNSAQRSL